MEKMPLHTGPAPLSKDPATASQEPARPFDYEMATTRQVCSWHQSLPTGQPKSLPASFIRNTHIHTLQLINKNLIITGFSKANVTEF
jgi:hypothetical protein